MITTNGSSTAPPQSSQKQRQTGGSQSSGSGGQAAAPSQMPKTYKVKAGDSFAAIAVKLNIDVDRLKQLNPDVDPLALQPGQKLKLR